MRNGGRAATPLYLRLTRTYTHVRNTLRNIIRERRRIAGDPIAMGDFVVEIIFAFGLNERYTVFLGGGEGEVNNHEINATKTDNDERITERRMSRPDETERGVICQVCRRNLNNKWKTVRRVNRTDGIVGTDKKCQAHRVTTHAKRPVSIDNNRI